MKILVTGSNGYIGCVIVPMLINEGHQVIGYDIDLYRECTYGKKRITTRFIKKDIRDIKLFDLQGFDTIIHLAALSNDPLGDLNPLLTYEINHIGSVNLAQLAKKAGVSRFLLSSSCSTYGASGDKILNESAQFNPVTPYGSTKVLAEKDISIIADDKFSPTFLRNATAYGVSKRMRFDLVLNNLVAWACSSGVVYIKSDGTPWRPLVHVEDIGRAFIAILHAPRETIHNQAFNIGSDTENYQIIDLARVVERVVPGSRIEFAKDAGPDKRCYRVDFGKFNSMFPAYRPIWTAEAGAKQLYESYRQNGIALKDFEGPKFKRIDHIKKLISQGRLDQNLRWVQK